MCVLKLIAYILILFATLIRGLDVSSKDFTNEDVNNTKVGENRLAAQILSVLDHYKGDDPIGLPGVHIPDPIQIPNIRKSMGFATLNMKNVMAYGLSKFRMKHMNTDLKDLKVDVGILLNSMKVVGNYTLQNLFMGSDGPFTVILKDVFVSGNVTLGVELDGKIRTQDILIDIKFSDMAMDFQNLGLLGTLFQGVINSAPTLVFDTIKPLMLNDAYAKIREEVNSNIKVASKDHSFPNSISPLDMAISEARKKVRAMGYDPYKVPDYNRTVGVFSVKMSNTWIMGISSFYRVGNISLAIENNTITTSLQVGTQKITGSTQWDAGIGHGMITRAGQAQFTVQHIKAIFELNQPLDTRKKPQIKDLQIDLGNIQVRCDGGGTIDYIMEFVINVLPNLLRYQIMDAIENPIKLRIQEKLNQIDVEQAIKDHIEDFEKMNIEMLFKFKF